LRFEPRHALANGRLPTEAVRLVVGRVAAVAEPQDQSLAARDEVERGGHLGQQRRMAIADVEHQRHEHQSLCHGAERAQRGPHLQGARIEHVVQAQAIESQAFC